MRRWSRAQNKLHALDSMKRPTLGETFRAYCGETVAVAPQDVVGGPASVCASCNDIVTEMTSMPDAPVDIALCGRAR